MATLGDRVFDAGLSALDTEANRFDWCSQEPTTFTQATVTYTRANKVPPSISAPADRSGGGREVTVSAITDGAGTSTGQVTHYAITDTVNSRLLATGALSAAKDVANGGVVTSTAFTIGIPDPA
jgi:hypothetical protein